MDTVDIHSLIEDLEANIDDLETALAPLLAQSLPSTASSLPLLDRAKLYTTSVYAIENLIFNALNISGVDPKSHAVKTELDRVKQYFAKIKEAENPVGSRGDLTLDKAAAGRFVKAALAGNERVDRERNEQIARNRANAEARSEAGNRKRKSAGYEGDQHSGKQQRHSRYQGHGQGQQGGGSNTHKFFDSSPAPDHARRQKSNQPPRTKSEIANALKQGPLPQRSKNAKKKERRKSQQQSAVQQHQGGLDYGPG